MTQSHANERAETPVYIYIYIYIYTLNQGCHIKFYGKREKFHNPNLTHPTGMSAAVLDAKLSRPRGRMAYF